MRNQFAGTCYRCGQTVAAKVEKLLNDHKSQLANCERMLELLRPEWELFEARTGHNVYVARDYVDHLSAARNHRESIKLFEAIQAILKGQTDGK